MPCQLHQYLKPHIYLCVCEGGVGGVSLQIVTKRSYSEFRPPSTVIQCLTKESCRRIHKIQIWTWTKENLTEENQFYFPSKPLKTLCISFETRLPSFTRLDQVGKIQKY